MGEVSILKLRGGLCCFGLLLGCSLMLFRTSPVSSRLRSTVRSTAHSVSRRLIQYTEGLKVLRKEDYSTTVKLVFVAGMYGDGHGQLAELWKACENCVVDHELTSSLTKLFSEINSIELHAKFQNDVLGHLERLKAEHEGQDVVLVANSGPGTFDIPFPITLQKNDYPKHPDLVRLAGLAGRARVDLRLLVLLRGAEANMRGLLAHEQGLVYGYTARELVDLCEVRASQLLDVDPRFYECLDRDGGGTSAAQDAEGLARLGAHLGVRLAGGEAAFAEAAGRLVGGGGVGPPLDAGQALMVDFYRRCVEETRDLCRGKPARLPEGKFPSMRR